MFSRLLSALRVSDQGYELGQVLILDDAADIYFLCYFGYSLQFAVKEAGDHHAVDALVEAAWLLLDKSLNLWANKSVLHSHCLVKDLHPKIFYLSDLSQNFVQF